MSYGNLEKATELLKISNGATMLNTSFIERFNGTIRERLASMTRKCRHASSEIIRFSYRNVSYWMQL